jgi:hypothetical protein
MRRWVIVLLGGCWVSESQIQGQVDQIGDDSGDTGEDPGPLEFTALEPAFGTNAGGYPVVLALVGATPDLEVTFAGANAEVLERTATTVTVRAPAVGVVGPVDVKVEAGSRETTLERSFTYWEDGAGKVGLLGYVANYDFGRPYLDEPGRYREAEVYFVDPINYDYLSEFAPGMDDCKLNYFRPGAEPARFRPPLDAIRLEVGTEKANLTFDEQEDSFVGALDGFWFPTSGKVDLSVDEAPGWDSFVLRSAVSMPDAGFRMSVPSAESSPAYVDPSFDIQWTGGARADAVLVVLERYGLDGAVVDQVSCVLVDDGSHRIPDLWSDWIPFQQIDVYIGRVNRGEGALPYNGASVGLIGVHWWYGSLFADF